MIVDLEEKEESGWFDLPGGGRVELRLLSVSDVKEIRKACYKTMAEYPLLDGKYQRFEGTEFDDDLFNLMRLDRNIKGWENLLDRNEKPIPVTPENKVLLMERSEVFRQAVDAGLQALKDGEKARSEASEKNS
jgi:hypothetical protein